MIIQNHLNWKVRETGWNWMKWVFPTNPDSFNTQRLLGIPHHLRSQDTWGRRDSKTCNESMRTNENQWESIETPAIQTTRQLKPLGLGIWRCQNICWKQRCDVKTWRETSVWRILTCHLRCVATIRNVCRLTMLDMCRNCASHNVASSAALAQRPEPGRRVPCFDNRGKDNFDNKAT